MISFESDLLACNKNASIADIVGECQANRNKSQIIVECPEIFSSHQSCANVCWSGSLRSGGGIRRTQQVFQSCEKKRISSSIRDQHFSSTENTAIFLIRELYIS